MKKTLSMLVLLVLLQGITIAAVGEATPAISKGIVNKTAAIYWGKGEQFPELATVHAGTKLDVYEYDSKWVLVLYKTYISSQGEFKEHSFYGYLKRADIDCDPPLVGESSAKADTGPGKKKGKRPKPIASQMPPEPSAQITKSPEETQPPVETINPDEEFDWIIRTNGLQTQQVQYQGVTISCSFSLMAQKVGGTAPSSEAVFNGGIHTPYAATAIYSMKFLMSNALGAMGMSFLEGGGGFDVSMQAAGAAFYIDTGSEDFALVNFTLPMQATGTLDPSIMGNTGSGTVKADAGNTSASGNSSISVQIKKIGGSYKFVLLNLKPGGGNLEYPAVLEKTFADPDRFDKEAAKADARRKKAEAERDRKMEEMKKKAEEEAKAAVETLAPLTPITNDLPPLGPLTPITDDLPPLAPLVPIRDDDAPPFPGTKSGLERGITACA